MKNTNFLIKLLDLMNGIDVTGKKLRKRSLTTGVKNDANAL